MNNVAIKSQNIQKTDSGIPIENIWYMLLYALKILHLKKRWKSEIEKAPNLDTLLSSILAKQIQQRLRIGLGHNYCKRGNEIYGVRGRIDFDKSLKLMSFSHGRTFSRYQVYLTNIKKNQIIKSILTRMIQIGDFGKNKNIAKEKRNELRCIVQEMGWIDTTEIKPDEVRRTQINERDKDYSLMLSLCYLLCRCLMPREEEGTYSLMDLNRDDLILYNIYEKFVAEFYNYHLTQWHVKPQSHLSWPSEDSLDYIPIMKPDLILQHKEIGQIIIIDTKFTKASITQGQWGNLTFNRDHMFQIYTYLRTQEEVSKLYKKATGILLYPTVNKHLPQKTCIQGHTIKWETIDLAQPWNKIEKDLLEVINIEKRIVHV